jgi:flagellar biosynthesis/type III secretory pathway protein FliH
MQRFGSKKSLPEAPADGPARVMKGSDWGAVAETGMKGFQMDAIAMPGRAMPKPTPEQAKSAQLEKELRKAEDTHKAAIAKAKAEGEAATVAAKARGREEGLREGEKKAMERYQKSLDDLRGNANVGLDVLSQEKAALFLEFEGQALELVSAAIHRVFEGFAKEQAEAVLPLLRKAIAALGQASSITLKVNPTDFKTVGDNRDFWLPLDASEKDVRVISDERIAKGGCFVESDSTSVGIQADELADRIDEELKRVFAAKAQALRGAAPAPEAAAPDSEDMPASGPGG